MSLVCSVIFIHHAFNANILDKDYAFSDGEILGDAANLLI